MLKCQQESLLPRTVDEADDRSPLSPEPASPLAAARRAQESAMQLRRKHKTVTISSNVEPSKFRTRSMIIVYYDSAVQDSFEKVVRQISIARNNLRKGKMAAKMMQMTSRHEGLLPGGGDDDPVLSTRLAFSRMSRMRASTGAGGDEKSVYDKIDQGLEAAQNLSEHGAHQFLRDGDCSSEIFGIRSTLGEVAELAKAELDKQPSPPLLSPSSPGESKDDAKTERARGVAARQGAAAATTSPPDNRTVTANESNRGDSHIEADDSISVDGAIEADPQPRSDGAIMADDRIEADKPLQDDDRLEVDDRIEADNTLQVDDRLEADDSATMDVDMNLKLAYLRSRSRHQPS